MTLLGPERSRNWPSHPAAPRAALYLTSLQEYCWRLGLGCKAVFSSTLTLELASVVPIEAIAVLYNKAGMSVNPTPKPQS